MKLLVALAAIVGLSAASAMAGEGRVSNQSLARLGLGGMQALSDAQGLSIRGLGVSEGTNGNENIGQNNNQQQGEKNQCHDQKCHEKQHEHCSPCHESNCRPSCHVESICRVQTCCHCK